MDDQLLPNEETNHMIDQVFTSCLYHMVLKYMLLMDFFLFHVLAN